MGRRALGTRTAARQSESKSKLMPNLFESRGFRRLRASPEQPYPNLMREGLPTNSEVGGDKASSKVFYQHDVGGVTVLLCVKNVVAVLGNRKLLIAA